MGNCFCWLLTRAKLFFLVFQRGNADQNHIVVSEGARPGNRLIVDKGAVEAILVSNDKLAGLQGNNGVVTGDFFIAG